MDKQIDRQRDNQTDEHALIADQEYVYYYVFTKWINPSSFGDNYKESVLLILFLFLVFLR